MHIYMYIYIYKDTCIYTYTFAYLSIYLSIHPSIDLLPVAELIIQNNGSACAMDIDGMLCQYGGLSNTFDLSRWAYRCPGSGA